MSTAEINVAGSNRDQRPSLLAHAARIALESCLCRLPFWAWVVLVDPWGAIVIRGASPFAPSVWPVLAFFAGIVATMLFVEHFVSYRARLVPHFRRVHLAALAICGGGMFGLLGAWLALWCRTSLVPIAGASLLAFALGCWTLRRPWLPVIGYVLIILAVANRRAGALATLAFFETVPSNIFCLVAGGLLLVWFGFWLYGLDEAAPAYDRLRRVAASARFIIRMPRRQAWVLPGQADAAGSARVRLPTALLFRLQDRLLEAGLRRGPGWIGWQVLRWELAWPQLLLVPAGLLIALLLAVQLIVTAIWCLIDWQTARPIYTAGLLAAGTVVPLVMVLFVHLERCSLLAVESLRPISRRQLMRQWGAGILGRLAGALLLFGIFLSLAALTSNVRGDGFAFLAWSSLLAAVLMMDAALMVFLPTIRREVLRAVVVTVGAVLSFSVVAGVASAETRPAIPPGIILAIVPLVAATSVGTLWLAYRRWLSADLD